MAIDAQKICENLKELGKIGFINNEGTCRVAYSEEFIKGRNFVRSLMEAAGLKTSVDAVGNLSGILEGSDASLPRIAVGSHIDSVPTGGIYDGCLGVISAIECICEMHRNGFQPKHTIEVIAFVEEEGNAVGGTFGSKCFVGASVLSNEIKKASTFRISPDDIRQAKRDCNDYAAYLELHIEQGGILEKESKDIGIVEGIVGIARWKVEIHGDANHAGTTPMYLRNDAMQKSVLALDDLYKRVSSRNDGMVCTVGIFDIENPAVNVVPAKTSFCIETRHSEPAVMHDVMHSWMNDYASYDLSVSPINDQTETHMAPEILDIIETSCKKRQFSYKRMFSGAGHDAMNMADFVPSAMIFIPSIGGISHNIKEFSTVSDIQNGTQVLYDVLCDLSAT